MKRLVVMSLLVALVMGFAVMPAAAKTTVTFWHAMSQGHGPILEEITKRFNESQDEIEVVLVYQGGYGDLRKKMLGAVASRKAPVMAQAYEDWTTKLVEANLIEPVSKYVGSVYTEDEMNDYFEAFRLSNSWNGTMYSVPFNKSTNLLYVNTDMVTEIPGNWNELVATAKKATKDVDGDGNIDVYGFGIRPTVDTFNIFLRQAGGDFLNEDETEAVFNNEAGQEALQFLVDLVYKHKAAIIYQGYLNELLGEGKVAMYEDSSAGMVYAEKAVGGKFNWTAAPLVVGKTAAAPFMGTNVLVFSQHSDEVKKAAFEYIKFLTNTENTVLWATQTGYLPVLNSALKTPEWRNYIISDKKNAAGAAQIKYGTYDPKPNGWYDIRSTIGDYVQAALLQKMTVKEALDKAAEDVNKILARNNR